MKCAWQAYLQILPHWMRNEVDKLGKDSLQELRIRIDQNPELCFQRTTAFLSQKAVKEDISYIINAASEYSPWSAESIGQGFITSAGGHRIGICGTATVNHGIMSGITNPSSLCIRVARDFDGISHPVGSVNSSILILGPPGSGKTTFLRDLIRYKSSYDPGSVAVIDEREEIFPKYKGKSCFREGNRTDILSGCPKGAGIETVLRSMNPSWIAVDEITAKEDCAALLNAGWCGAKLLATAHAGSLHDFETRPVYHLLREFNLFPTILVLQKDKTWKVERTIL